MALFKPYMMLNRLTDLTPEMLEKAGVKGLLLDVDNTLSRHFDKVPFDGVTEFVKEMRQKGIKLIVLSNSPKSRVEPFAKKLSLDFECDASVRPPVWDFGKIRSCFAAISFSPICCAEIFGE